MAFEYWLESWTNEKQSGASNRYDNSERQIKKRHKLILTNILNPRAKFNYWLDIAFVNFNVDTMLGFLTFKWRLLNGPASLWWPSVWRVQKTMPKKVRFWSYKFSNPSSLPTQLLTRLAMDTVQQTEIVASFDLCTCFQSHWYYSIHFFLIELQPKFD